MEAEEEGNATRMGRFGHANASPLGNILEEVQEDQLDTVEAQEKVRQKIVTHNSTMVLIEGVLPLSFSVTKNSPKTYLFQWNL